MNHLFVISNNILYGFETLFWLLVNYPISTVVNIYLLIQCAIFIYNMISKVIMLLYKFITWVFTKVIK